MNSQFLTLPLNSGITPNPNFQIPCRRDPSFRHAYQQPSVNWHASLSNPNVLRYLSNFENSQHQYATSISRLLRSAQTYVPINSRMFRTLPSPKSLWAPASEGFGYFQGGPGLRFGPGCCFKLQAKLGFSTTPSMRLRVRFCFIFDLICLSRY
jgi:hypothetical protein